MGGYYGGMALARESMIPLMGQAPEGAMSNAVKLSDILQQGAMQRQMFPQQLQAAEQRNEMGQLAIEQAQQQKQDEDTFRQALVENNGDYGKALQSVSGKISPQTGAALQGQYEKLLTAQAAQSKEQRAAQQAQIERATQLYSNFRSLDPQARLAALPAFRQQLSQVDPGAASLLPTANPEALTDDALAQGLGLRYALAKHIMNVPPGGTAVDVNSGKPIYTAPPKPAAEAKPVPGRDVPFPPEVEAQKERIAKLSRSNMLTADQSDAKDVAQAIADGQATPVLTSYSFRDRTAIAAELRRLGYNQARAEQDYRAVSKQLQTLNGAQQTRLRQAISSAGPMLDKIDDLYQQWKQLAPVSGFKVLNKATLAAMKNAPGKAGAVATALDAQIADLTSDLGNIYMGGNSPTDHALGLAGKNLRSDWNQQTFEEAIKQTRLNLKIRENSILNTQPIGVTPNSPYAPPTQQGGQNQTAAPELTPPSAAKSGMKWQHRTVNGQVQWRQVPQ